MILRRPLSRPARRPTSRLALEPRIVFDGAMPVAAADAVDHHEAPAAHAPAVERNPTPDADAGRAEPNGAAIGHRNALNGSRPTMQRDAPSENIQAEAAPAPDHEIAFVDSSVADIEAFLPGFKGEVITIQSGSDGFDQIAAALAGRTDITAIHILGHGGVGSVSLGDGTLDATSIATRYAADLATISAALVPHGDILLYACDVAAGTGGQAFISSLAAATGDTIAASTDATGAAALGGNWILEAHTGVITAKTIDASGWNGLLVAPVLNLGGTANALIDGGFDNRTQPVLDGDNVQGTTYGAFATTGANIDVIKVNGGSYAQGPDNANTGNQYVTLQGGGTIVQSFTITTTQTVSFGASFAIADPSTFTASTELAYLANSSGTTVGTGAVALTTASNAETFYAATGSATLTAGTYYFLAQTGADVVVDSAYVRSGATYNTVYAPSAAPIAIASSTDGVTTTLGTTLSSATITITNVQAGDLLSKIGSVSSAIAVSAYNAATGTITLTGTDTLAHYAAALTQIGFSNSTATPATAQRTINVTVNDGTTNSNTAQNLVTIDYTPVANADSFSTPHNVPITLDVRANDTDTSLNAIAVDKVNGTAINQSTAPIAVTGGTVSLTSSGSLLFTPTTGYTGSSSFTYNVIDAYGNESAAATVSGTVTDQAPVVDLNSTSASNQDIVNGSFTGGASGWTATGNGTASNNYYYWDTDGGAGTLTQTNLTNLNRGYGTQGAAAVTFDLGWNNGSPDSTVPATLDLTVGGVLYARFTSNPAGGNGPTAQVGTFTFFNGASGPVNSVTSSSYLGWTFTHLTVNLPSTVAATGNLVISYNAGTGGLDDIAIDNVSVLTRTDPVAGNNYATSYTENATPVSIASSNTEIWDNDDTTVTSATIVLTNAQAGDVLTQIALGSANIAVSQYNESTHTVTLTGSDTAANYAAAIRTIGFANTTDSPSTTPRAITVTVNDGLTSSAVATTTVNVVSVNDAPVVNLSNNANLLVDGDFENNVQPNINANNLKSLTYGAYTATSQINIIRVDGTGYTPAPDNAYSGNQYLDLNGDGAISQSFTLSSAQTISFGGVFSNRDNSLTGYVAPTTTINILDSGGNVVATGSAVNLTRASGNENWYSSTGTVSLAAGTYTYRVTLGNFAQADAFYVRNTSGYASSYTENAAPTPIAGAGDAVTDLDNTTMTSATITLTNAQSLDVLSVIGTLPTGITASTYNSTTGVLTLSGTATSASYAAAIAQIGYSSTSENPSATPRVIDVTVNDGTSNSNVGVATINVIPVNDAPTSTAPASVASPEDTTLAFIGGNALTVADVDSPTLTVSLNVGHGTLTLGTTTGLTFTTGNGSANASMVFSGTQAQLNNALASLSFRPSPDYNGSDTLAFNTSDGSLSTAKSIALTVTPVADITPDSVTTNENSAISFNAITGTNGATPDTFSDPSRAVTSVTQGSHGSVTFTAAGVLTYTPNSNFHGTDTFTYTVTAGGTTETATETVTVNAVNQAPTSTAPTMVSSAEDTTLAFTGGNALGVSDVDSTTLTVSLNVGHGTLTLGTTTGLTFTTGNGTANASMVFSGTQAQLNAALASLTFRPSPDYNGSDTLAFDTSDGSLSTAKSIALTVTPVADITADSVTTNENSAIAFNAITGTNGATADTFSDPNRAVTSVTQGQHGSVSYNADGTLTYTPNANFHGTDTFTYTVTAGGTTETATETVTVNAVNQAPTSTAPAGVTGNEDTTFAFSGANALMVSDVDSPNLTVTLSVGHGTLTLGTTTGLAFTTGNGTANTSMTFSGTQAQLNNALASLSFRPSPDYNGNDTLSFNTSDGSLSTAKSIALTITPVADITPDSVTTNENAAIAFNAITGTNGATADTFSDPNRAVTSVTQGQHGSVSYNADGTLTYTPNANFHGTDTFTYTVTAGGTTETATETVTVNFVNQAPTSSAPTAVTSPEDTTLAFTGGNALTVADVDSTNLTVALTVTRGTLTLGTTTGLTFTIGNGTANTAMTFSGTQAQLNAALASLSFRPNPDYNGSATLGFNTSDGSLSTAKSIALTVTPVADITADTVTTNENSAISFNAITGTNGATADTFSDPNRAVTSVTQGTHGTVSYNADGTLTYTPNSNFHGTDTFNYTVTAGGTTETATETVTVNAVNQAPTSTAPTMVSSPEDTTLAFTGGNALTVADVDSPNLTVSLNVGHGTLTLGTTTGLTFTTGNGTANASMVFSGTQAQLNAALASLTFRPSPDYNGSDTLAFNTSDGSLSTAKSIALTVTPVADITADSVTTNENSAIAFNAITGTNGATADTFSDPNRAVSSVTQGAHGGVSYNADGTLTYTPNTNFVGTDTFTYTVTAGGTTETATETVTVGAVNQAPTSTAPTSTTSAEDTTLAFTGGNALTVADIDSPTLTVTLGVGHGTLTLGTTTGLTFTTGNGTANTSMTFSGTQAQLNNALASLSFRPSPDYNGNDTLSFNTSDGSLSTAKSIALTITPVADITPDSVITNENTVIAFNAITGTNGATADTFSDPNRAVTSVTQGQHGSVSYNADGTLTYTPNANFSGTDTFTYTVTAGGTTETATETVTVNFVNQAPTSTAPTSVTVTEDTTRGFRNANGLSVDDIDSPDLTVTLSVSQGTLTLGTTTGLTFTTGNGSANATMTFSGTQAQLNNALSSLNYRANPDYNGADTLDFITSDGSLSTTKSIALTVTPVADITADSVTTNENNAIAFNAITGTNGATADTFSDPNRAVTAVGSAAHGTVSFNADGTLTYTPNANFYGTDTFTYTVTAGGTTETATETVDVTFVNQAPTSTAPTTVTSAEDTIATFNGANALSVSDVDSTTLTVSLNVGHGTLTLGTTTGLTFTTGNGTANASMVFSGTQAQLNAALASLTFRPSPDYNGSDTLAFNTSDGSLSTAKSIALTVTPVADITADSVTTNENSAISFNAITGTNGATADTFSDPNRAVTAVTQGTNGTVSYNADGTLTYTPNANFYGTDTFDYTVTAGGTTETATETVTVNFVNQAPTSTAPTGITSAEDTTVNFNGPNALMVADVDSPTLTVSLNVSHGTLTLGTTTGLTFTNGNGNANMAMSFTGTQAQLNTALASLSFRPDPDYNGSAVLGFNTSDGSLTAAKSVALTITPVADITPDSITTNENTAISFNAITGTNGATPDTFSDPSRAVTSVTQGQHGSVGFNADGTLTYTPNADFFGSDSYSYTVTAGGTTETASVTMTVVHVNQAPVANNDSFTAAEDATATIDVRANDTDADGDPLTVTAVNGQAITAGGAGVAVTGGTITLGSGGDLVFTPTAYFHGSTSFSYTVADPSGATSTATVSGTITPVNHAPNATDDTGTIDEDHNTSGNVLGNDSDPDGDPLTVSAVNGNGANVGNAIAGSNGGLFTIQSNGAYAFATNGAFEDLQTGQSRTTTVTYTAADGQGGTATATITITVTGVNDPPVANPDSYDTTDTSGSPNGVPLSNNVLTNDTDVEHDTITVSAVNGNAALVGVATAGSYGSLTLNANGTFTYSVDQTNAAVLGLLRGQAPLTDQFTYTDSDGHGGTNSTTLTIRVQGTNDGPMAGNDSNSIVQGQASASGNVITGVRTDGSGTTTTVPSAMDTDPGFTLNVNAIRLPNENPGTTVTGTTTGSRAGQYGTITIDANGNYTYVLNNGSAAVQALIPGQPVTEMFVYSVTDGVHTIEATITVSIDGINDPPVAQNDSFTTAEGTSATINVRSNDSDPDHDPIRVTAVNGTALTAGGAGVSVTGGVVTLDTSGDLVYTPGTYYHGSPSFTYTIEDPSGANATATVSGTVTPINHAPTAVADTFTTAENAAVTINVLANDSDVDGDPTSVTQINGNAVTAGGPGVVVNGGVVTLGTSGSLLFTPDTNFNGSVAFNYTIADPSGATASAAVNGNVAHVNQAPVAVSDQFTSAENTTATINVRANDSDPDGDAITVTQVNGTAITAGGAAVAVTGGTVILDNAGNLEFTPTGNYHGTTSFNYTISDPFGATGSATVSGTVTSVNHAPVAAPDSFSVTQGSIATIDARANDSDPDGDPLTITQVNGTAITAGGAAVAVTGGTVALDNAGNLVFTPTAGYSGSTTFAYTIADPSGATSTASVMGTVLVDHAPIANPDSFTSAFNTPATIDVRANDTDADNDPLTVTQVNGTAIVQGGAGVAVTGGIVTLDASGSLVFTPTPNFSGPTSFDYTISDPAGETGTAAVSGTIAAPANHAPVANPDSFTSVANTPVTIDVRANDTDADNDPLTVTQVNGTAIVQGGAGVAVTGGIVTLDASGNLVFTPTPNFVGPTSFDYTISDPSGATGSAAVSGTIAAPGNHAPVANPDSFTSVANTPVTIDVRANDTDADNDPLTVTQVNGTAIASGGAGVAVTGGTVTLDASGNLVFTPTPNFVGPTSFDYTISDPSGATGSAAVSGTIAAPGNHAPVAVGDAFTISAGTVAVVDVRANDADVDGDPLTVTQINGTSIVAGGAGVAVAGGTVTLDASGDVVFTPSANFAGSTSFTYVVKDPSGATSTATVSGTVTRGLHEPIAMPDTISIPENAGPTIVDVRGNDVDVDNDPLTITQINGMSIVPGGTGIAVAGGTVTLDASGNLLFTPTANVNGPVSFSYTISDPSGSRSTATVGIAVTPGAHAPMAVPDTFTIAENAGATALNVRGNDVDADNNPLTITQINGQSITSGGPAVVVTGGSVMLDASGNLFFTPTTDTNGPVSFSYTISDPSGSSSTASVSVGVAPGAHAPVAIPDHITISENAAATVLPVLGNDVDADNNPLTITRINGQAIVAGGPGITVIGGVLNLDAAGRLLLTPAANFNGPVVFAYTISDPAGSSSTTTATVNVAPLDIGPVARPDLASGSGMVTVDVLANDTDASGTIDRSSVQLGGTAHPGDPLAIPGQGTFTIDRTTGAITFTPVAGFTGTATASYSVADGNGLRSAMSPLSATITASNHAPVANPDSFTVAENTTTTINVLANDTDADGDALTVTQVDGQAIVANGPSVVTAAGSFTLDSSGNLHFTPTPNSNGPVTFTYTVRDPSGATSTAAVSGSVTPIAGTPLAAPDVAFGEAGAPITIAVLSNDRAVPGDPVAITAIDGQAIAVGGPGVAIAGGVVTLAADGTLHFIPNASNGSLGQTSFTYTITSRSGASSSAVVELDLFGVTNPPLPNPDGSGAYVSVPPVRFVPSTTPALFVLQSVSETRSEFAVQDPFGNLGVDAPDAAEIMQGLRDDLDFASGGRIGLIGRSTDLIREGVNAHADSLFVQHAVRYETLPTNDVLYVHREVQRSQEEAALLALRASSPDGATLGATTLLDPFALGTAGSLVPVHEVVPAPKSDPSKPRLHTHRHAAHRDEIPLDKLSIHGAKRAPASGFSAQLRHSADGLRARHASHDRSATTVVPRDERTEGPGK